MQVLNQFGDGQNCQNQTFKWLYQLYKSKYEKSFFGKTFTVKLFHTYQVFSSLLGHLHFSLHFFSTFMEQLFLNHPISGYDAELVLVEKLSQYTYRPIYLSVLQVKYFSVSILALKYINKHINRFHGHQSSKSMVSKGKSKQNQ